MASRTTLASHTTLAVKFLSLAVTIAVVLGASNTKFHDKCNHGSTAFGEHCICHHPMVCEGKRCSHARAAAGNMHPLSGWLKSSCPKCRCHAGNVTEVKAKDGSADGDDDDDDNMGPWDYGSYDTQPPYVVGEREFLSTAGPITPEKVEGNWKIYECLKSSKQCGRPDCSKPKCRSGGHYYNTIYQTRLGLLTRSDVQPFQFLEIGYYKGAGYTMFSEFMPKAEVHSIDVEPGPRSEGKWPEYWGNRARNEKRFKELREARRVHSGNSNSAAFLSKIWTEEMKRPDAPPLKVVVKTSYNWTHKAADIVQSIFFWFPRIQPGGMMVIEDLESSPAELFLTQFLPQLNLDLHFCGAPGKRPCFPTLQPLLHSIHCEMHICVLERNDSPAIEPSLSESTAPPNALDFRQCQGFGLA